MNKDIIVGLDFGSSVIRIAVGQETESGERNFIHIIGAAEVSAEGIHRGIVTSIDDAVSSISSCIERAEHIIGAPIERAIIGITGSHIISQPSRGVIGISRQDGEITEDDIERAIEAARTVPIPSNHEILHVIPKGFTIDGQSGIKDPREMTGIRLEVDTEIIQGVTTQIKNITKSIYRTSIDIEDVVFSILATSEAVVTSRQKEIGVLVVNIGASTTSLIVFEEGDVLHTSVLSIGSEHITSDIAIGLRTSIDVAERVKIEAGTALTKDVGKKEEINLRDFGGLEDEYVSRKYVADIIEARVEEIFDKINSQLKGVGRSGLLPGGVVLTGGGAKIPGIVDVAKRRLKLPALLGYPLSITGITDRINDLSFTTAVGLVLWGENLRTQDKGFIKGLSDRFNSADKVVKKVKKWFGSIMP
ncbi:MAG: cell division protein FtsA [Patescibacteria group bacterium]|nr:cell division protein FtsA [Patescibacteria group bacterium]